MLDYCLPSQQRQKSIILYLTQKYSVTNDYWTIVVSNCHNTLSEDVFSGATDFIPKDNISQWYLVRQDGNLLLGVVGAAVGTYTGAFVGTAEWYQ
mgnify:CR=1 FL=1